MDRRALSRVFSAVIVAIAFAFLLYQSASANFAMGKEHYLARQSASYDVSYSAPPQLGASVFAFFTVVGFLGIYELLALGIYKVINWHPQSEGI